MEILRLLGTTLGLGLTAGVNLYATVLVTGCAVRFGWLDLPAELSGLAILSHPVILLLAAFVYTIEFFADKIPAVDHLWDLLQSFFRPIGGAAIAWLAVEGAHVPALTETAIVLLAGGTALSGHIGKASARITTASSGGHFVGLGVVMSLLEDLFSVAFAFLAVAEPVIALVLVCGVLVLFGIVAPKLFRLAFSRVQILRYGLVHKVLHRSRTRIPRGSIPFSVAQQIEMFAGGTHCVTLPAFAVAIRGLPRWKSGFAVLTQNCATFVHSRQRSGNSATFVWADCATSLVRTILGCRLCLDSEKGREIISFYPMTNGMMQELRTLVPVEHRMNVEGRQELGVSTERST